MWHLHLVLIHQAISSKPQTPGSSCWLCPKRPVYLKYVQMFEHVLSWTRHRLLKKNISLVSLRNFSCTFCHFIVTLLSYYATLGFIPDLQSVTSFSKQCFHCNVDNFIPNIFWVGQILWIFVYNVAKVFQSKVVCAKKERNRELTCNIHRTCECGFFFLNKNPLSV